MITIYGSPKTSSGRCYWTLEEIGIEYQEKAINFKEKEHLSPEFLKLNPNGKIPALVDGDFVCWESMAINMYLCETYKPELLGKNSEAKGLSFQWSFWANGDLQTPLIENFIQLVFVPEAKRDQSIIDKNLKKLPELFEMLDKNLETSKYLAGDEFTLADLNTASVVLITEAINLDLSKFKNLTNWLNTIKDRSAFKRYQKLRN
jgi:glutathione S-transferase